jgi:hypothetical protein
VNIFRAAIVASSLLLAAGPMAEAWSMKKAPLMTRWAGKVDPNAPLPEYPRPQLVRKDWLNLNGIWEYQPGAETDAVPAGRKLSSEILVPFPVESALSGVMEHHDRLWYRRSFNLPPAWRGRQIILHFGAVDFESEVFINGKAVGMHRGGYDPFSYDITPCLDPGEAQEIIVRIFDPTDNGGQPRGKQSLKSHGVMYTPTTGIWQTVWLEPVAADGIDRIKIIPDIDAGAVKITVTPAYGAKDKSIDVSVMVKDGATTVSKASGAANREINLPLPHAKLWSPDHPFLYGLEISASTGGKAVDRVTSYFGMRKIEVADVGGFEKILLNRKFLFQVGTLDQGFWPDGVYTAPTDDAIKFDLQTMKDLGLNMVRKHLKVEPARWYYWTDHLGLLVWQDMPSPNTYPADGDKLPPVDQVEFESELVRIIEALRNVPSIVMWDVFNEGQGQFDTPRLVAMVKALDPTRLVNQASGGGYAGVGDVYDLHLGKLTLPPLKNDEATVIGEFGGIWIREPGHVWEDGKGGPVDPAMATSAQALYEKNFFEIRDLRDKQGLSAADYTQFTDVEAEQNGLLTYDRIPKMDVARLALANRFELPRPIATVVVPTSQTEAQDWKYTTQAPGPDWMAKNFDDSHWQDGKGGFGVEVPDHGLIGTPWTSDHIWMRRHFNPGAITTDQIAHLCVSDYHDEDIEMYINGVPAYRATGYLTRYETKALTVEGRKALAPNADNVLAVSCLNKEAGQYVDVGLTILKFEK